MTSDPFDVLGIAPRFDVDLEALDRRVRDLSRALHPDRHAGASAGERRSALSHSIDVNDAFRLLKNPIRRAEVLRTRIAGETAAAEPRASQGLLLEMMDLREALSDARREQNLPRIQALAEPVQRREEALLRELDVLFEKALQDGTLELPALDEKLSELRYLRRFLDEVSTLEDEL